MGANCQVELSEDKHIRLNVMFGIMFRVDPKPVKRQDWIDFIMWGIEVVQKLEPGILRFDMY